MKVSDNEVFGGIEYEKLILAVLCAAAVTAGMMPAAFAAVPPTTMKVGSPSAMTSFNSTQNESFDNVKVSVDGDQMNVEFKTSLKFQEIKFAARSVKKNAPSARGVCRDMTMTTKNGYRIYKGTVNKYAIADNGQYYLVILGYRKGSTKSVTLYRHMLFKKSDSGYKILKYSNVVDRNNKFTKKFSASKYAASKYKDVYMKDVQMLVLRDPKTKKLSKMTPSRVKYIKSQAKKITAGSTTKYGKDRKIYQYMGRNFYYDNVSHENGGNGALFIPYLNLLHQQNKKKSMNSSNGRVGTVCIGYAALNAELCRAVGIPARIVYGHHISNPHNWYRTWTAEPKPGVTDHWWVEAWINGRWVAMDPTAATGNKWSKGSDHPWTYTGLTTMAYFDPTVEQLSQTHVTYGVVDFRYGDFSDF
ncbi:MAG: transglutaminase-like domain-containing protein [Eubacteriales bacterium]|nr:transglutaminase-like domain-containing protein [Eubacteriales bacterium]